MSVSKWSYEPTKCDGHYCPGECDLCALKDEEDEDEQLRSNKNISDDDRTEDRA